MRIKGYLLYAYASASEKEGSESHHPGRNGMVWHTVHCLVPTKESGFYCRWRCVGHEACLHCTSSFLMRVPLQVLQWKGRQVESLILDINKLFCRPCCYGCCSSICRLVSFGYTLRDYTGYLHLNVTVCVVTLAEQRLPYDMEESASVIPSCRLFGGFNQRITRKIFFLFSHKPFVRRCPTLKLLPIPLKSFYKTNSLSQFRPLLTPQ